MKRSPVVMMTVPIPVDIRAWIERKAEQNLYPMSSAITVALRAQMAAERRSAEAVER